VKEKQHLHCKAYSRACNRRKNYKKVILAFLKKLMPAQRVNLFQRKKSSIDKKNQNCNKNKFSLCSSDNIIFTGLKN